MKIIYDSDNNIDRREENPKGVFQTEDVDLNGSAKPQQANVGVPQNIQTPPQTAPQSAEIPPQAQPVYGMAPMTQEQFNFMMAQFAAMQQMMPPLDQNGQPIYNGVQPQPFIPYAPYQVSVTPVPPQPVESENTGLGSQNPGTRVLFQSEDFEKQEPKTEPQRKVQEPQFKKQFGIEDIEEEIVDLSDKKKKDASPFSVDETQMTMFELGAMRKKQGLPEYKRSDIEIEEEAVEKKPNQASKTKAPQKPQQKGKAAQGKTSKSDLPEEKKKLPTSEIIRRAVLAVSLVAILIAGGMLLNEYRLSKQNDRLMDDMSDLIIDNTSKPKEEKPDKEEETTKPLTPEEQWAKLKNDYLNVRFPEGLQLKYAKLYATNPEFVGYLSAEGVGLNLPVVQTTNDSKYLNKSFNLQNTKYGCPFVTHLNNIETLDMNTVIFGHHMNNGTIFGALDKYKSIEGFKKAPVITFNTLYKDYSWKVIAVILTNAYEKDDNGYIFRYYFTQLSTTENFSAYLSELSQRSLYDTGVDVLPTDKLLTLSTCSHDFTDARLVVVARLTRPGESTEVDTSRATVNPSPRYPQAWYDKKGKTNPYKNAFQWEVS